MADDDAPATQSPARQPARSNSNSRRSAARTDTSALERQIADLRREVSRINRVIAAQVEDAAEEVESWYDSAANGASRAVNGASRAVREVRSQAGAVSEVVRENPVTFSSAAVLGGLFGILVGLALSRSHEVSSSRWHWPDKLR